MSETNGKCSVPNCIHHIKSEFNSHVDGDMDKSNVKYEIFTHFTTLDDLLEAAAREMNRRCQLIARKNKFPVGRVVDVDAKGKFVKTKAEKVADFKAMYDALDNDDDRAAFVAAVTQKAKK